MMYESRADREWHEAYYQEISDGCGCTELWEYMSKRRGEERIVSEP